ncbi:MAG: DNA polymerase III subunit beta [Chloroflexi bacterium]|nr:DNA polymerase III subunit beta [Chloroflexota bacterium]
MKVTCLQENISKGLGVVSRAVAVRTTLPITNNVLLSTDQGRLKLATTNLEVAIVHWIGAKVEEEGAITVPARILSDFINSLPNENVSLNLLPENKNLEIKCARFEARLSGMDAEEFPPIPEIGDGIAAKVDAEAFRSALGRVVFAAATEDSRPVLTGVNAEFQGDTLTLAAADGFRLSVDKVTLAEPISEDVTVIIPAKALSEVSRLIGDTKDPVSITVNPTKSQVLFEMDDVRLVSQLIQGSFPNYGQLIPQSHTTRATVDVEDFLRATRAASIFARGASGIVRLQMLSGDGGESSRLAVSARAEEVGDDLGEIDARMEGDDAKIAFNSKYLTDVLGVLAKGEVALETSSPSSPGLIRPLGNDHFIHVVMPMFVQW